MTPDEAKAITGLEMREVLGVPGYFASSDGRIFSTKFKSGERCRPMYTYKNRKGYLQVNLRTADGRRRKFMVHAIVLSAFAGPRPPGMECRHLNGVSDDNRSCNLKWGTREENDDDRRCHGKKWNRGSMNGRAKLTESLADHIRGLRYSGLGAYKVARQFGVSQATIAGVWNGRYWKGTSDHDQ